MARRAGLLRNRLGTDFFTVEVLTLKGLGERPLRRVVGSRTGAVLRRFSLSVAPRFLWECLTSQTVNWFPAPAASNPSCRFPAMGLPACFESRVMRRFCLHLDI